MGEVEIIFGAVVTAAVSYLGWDKRQDKLKIKDLEDDVGDLRVQQARQDERHTALTDTVSEIRQDTKDIKQLLMEKI